jgi:hypothetical protein
MSAELPSFLPVACNSKPQHALVNRFLIPCWQAERWCILCTLEHAAPGIFTLRGRREGSFVDVINAPAPLRNDKVKVPTCAQGHTNVGSYPPR